MRGIVLATVILFSPVGWAAPASLQEQLDQLLIAIVTAVADKKFDVLNNTITEAPLDTEQLVATCLQAGCSAEDVQNQCATGITDNQIKTIMQLLIQEDAPMEPMIATCLPNLSPAAIGEVMTMIFQEVSPLMLESTAQMAMAILAEEGINARPILLSSLAESQALDVGGFECGADCLSSFAENVLDNAGGSDGVAENIDAETAFSGS